MYSRKSGLVTLVGVGTDVIISDTVTGSQTFGGGFRSTPGPTLSSVPVDGEGPKQSAGHVSLALLAGKRFQFPPNVPHRSFPIVNPSPHAYAYAYF